MTPRLTDIFRHPVKAIGRERLAATVLSPGAILPWDRAFAVAHDGARAADLAGPWARKANYLRGVAGPALMAVTARFDETGQRLTLAHPDRPGLTVDPGTGGAALIDWLKPLWPADKSAPVRVVHHPGHGQTDMPDPWVSLASWTSHAAVAEKLGVADFSIHRWRANLWLDGLPAWREFSWIGRRFRIGDTVLEAMQRITRCKATMANPRTGRRDLDTLGALQAGWGHSDFGLYARVVAGGPIATGDRVEPPA